MLQQFLRRIAKLTAIGGFILSAGCTVVADSVRVTKFRMEQHVSGSQELKQVRKNAQIAWLNLAASGSAPSTNEDFADAFQEGYTEYLFRGRETPPPLPPARYRTPAYQNEAGYRASLQWIEGYKYGIHHARMSGQRRFVTGPAADTLQPVHAGIDTNQATLGQAASAAILETSHATNETVHAAEGIPPRVVHAVREQPEITLATHLSAATADAKTESTRPAAVPLPMDLQQADPPKRDVRQEMGGTSLEPGLLPATAVRAIKLPPALINPIDNPTRATIVWAPTTWHRSPESPHDRERPR